MSGSIRTRGEPGGGRGAGRWSGVWRRSSAVAAVALGGTVGAWAPAAAAASAWGADQDPSEAVMVAAGRWAAERVPGGVTHLDPHRSGAGQDGARVERIARGLGVGLETLERIRECEDVMNPATCRLTSGGLLAIAVPRIEEDRARVRVYGWYPSDSGSEPVTQRRWDLELRRSGGEWRVVSGG